MLKDERCDVFAGDFSLGGSFDSGSEYCMHGKTGYVVFLGDGIAKELAVLKAQHVARDCEPVLAKNEVVMKIGGIQIIPAASAAVSTTRGLSTKLSRL